MFGDTVISLLVTEKESYIYEYLINVKNETLNNVCNKNCVSNSDQNL